MDSLDRLVAMLANDGLDLPRDKAEALAIRVSGSVDAYIVHLSQRDADLAASENVQPPAGSPEKFGAMVGYEVKKPTK